METGGIREVLGGEVGAQFTLAPLASSSRSRAGVGLEEHGRQDRDAHGNGDGVPFAPLAP